MSANSKIEWTDATWNPLRAKRLFTGKVGWHCEKISPACDHCYAASMNKRSDGLVGIGTGLNYAVDSRAKVESFVDEKTLLLPLRWRKPRKIFVCSMTDLFGDWHDDYCIAQVFAVMALAHWHTLQCLTKRAERMNRLLSSEDFWELVDCIMTVIVDGEVDPLERRRDDLRATAPEVGVDQPLPNVWLGVTAENQEQADARIPLLLQTPAAKRFVSIEPMLGPVNLQDINLAVTIIPQLVAWHAANGRTVNIANYPSHGWLNSLTGANVGDDPLPGLDWVIAGGESGPGSRPSHLDWFRSLRDQCVAAGVPFFFKQWGEFGPPYYRSGYAPVSSPEPRSAYPWGDKLYSPRLGKKAAGRLLDGVEWSQFPGGAA